MSRTLSAALVALLLVLGCGDADGDRAEPPAVPTTAPATPAPTPATVTLYFTRNEQPVPVTRAVSSDSVTLAETVEALLQGPTDAERASGITSWFSAATAGRLRSAQVAGDGRAIVDFQDLAAVIPSASSSTGSTMLLQELNRTVFQHADVRTVEYRSNGSCEAFWNWLQYDCQVVSRPAP